MRTFAILAFVFAAASAPSFAAPILPTGICNSFPAACRVRAIGPISFAKPDITALSSGSKSNQQRGYEDEDSGAILATPWANDNGIRYDWPSLPHSPPPSHLFGGIRPLELKRSSDLYDLLARAAEDDESAAGIFGTIGSIFSSVFGGLLGGGNKRREVIELLARAAEDDESGAGFLSFLRPLAGPLINILTGGSNQQQQRRDLAAVVELLARANYELE